MDIAEIRNKAKAQQQKGSKDEASAAAEERSVEKVDTGQPVEPDSDEQRLTADQEAAEGAAADQVEPVTDAAPTGLEQLFFEGGNLELATEEDYEDALLLQDVEQQMDVRQYLSFLLGQEEYALDITQINEIIKVRELTDVPRVPDFILGIISLRGVVVPVFDLKKRFQLGEARLTSESRIIVCQLGEVIAGLLVDKINQVITISDSSLEPPPAVLSGLDRELVDAVGRFERRMVIVLKLQSVLDVELI